MSRARSVLLLAGLFLVPTLAFAAGIPIRGRVLDSSGAALAKAKVRLVPVAPSHTGGRLELEGKDGPEAVASVESGADGTFRLEAPDTGMWAVIAGGQGLVPQMTQVTPLLAELDLPAVRLPRDAGLTVRVAGPDGKPVPGARVRTVASRPKMRSDSWFDAPGLAVTDAEGKAVLPREASAAVTVRAGRSGLMIERKEIRAATLELRLDAGQDIPVRVLGADGKPAADVLVSREEDGWRMGPWTMGATDANGLLTLTAPGKSPLDLVLLAADGRSLTARVHPFAAREKPGVRELRLPASVEVPARVVSARDGRPVAGALVWLGADPGGFRRADGRGETRLALPETRELFVQAEAPGFLPDFRERSKSAAQRPLSFSLQPDLAVTGIVVDEAGRPVAGAEITSNVKTRPRGGLPFTSMMRIFRTRGLLVRSGPDGRFRWGGLSGGIEYELRVTKAGFAPTRVAVTPPAPDDRPASPLRVVLLRGRSAFGRVLGPDQRPIAGAQVTLRTSVPTGPDRFRAALEPDSLDTFEAVTGGDGRFDLLHLPAGRYDLTARGRGWAPLTVPTLEIPEGDRATDLGTLVLAPGVALEGTVVNAAGKPVEGAAIHVAEAVDNSFPFPLPMEEEPAGVSGLDGFFRIEDLRAGSTVNVSALRTGYVTGEAKGVQVPADPPVRITLQEVGAVSGRVVDPDGKPIAGASVRIDFRPLGGRVMRFGGAPQYDRSDPEGNFRIPDVTPGTVDLVAQAPGWQASKVADLELRGGEEKRGVEIVLSPAAVLEGRVLTPAGLGLPEAQVSLPFEESQGPGFHNATTDDEGRYALESLPPGHRTLEASHPDYGTARRQVELRLGENSLDITLEGGNEVAGRVVDDSGAPVAGAQVWLAETGSFRPLSTMSESDGSFRFAAVPAGNYRAGVEKQGFARSERVPVTVAGSVRGLELRLSRGGALVGRISGVEGAELSRVQVVAWGRGMPVGGRVQPDGSYRIDQMTEGEWRVRAELPGTALYAEGEVRLEPGASEARLDLEMERGLELSGRVRRNGAPVSGESLFLQGPAMRRSLTETDAEGRFRFQGLTAGSYHLQLEDPSGGPGHEERVDLQADREITIDLSSGEVTGRVVDAADASPLANATVQILGTAGQVPRPVRTDSRGVFVLRGVAEGSWRLRAQADGYAPAETDVRVDGAGPADEVELSLRATEGVTLQVATATGPPPRTLFYVVLDGAGRKIGDGTVAVGEAGRARLSRVPPGSWQTLLLAEGTAPLEIAVTSPGDAGRVTLPPPCTLRVKVPALADSPVPAKVSLIGAGGRPFRTFFRIGEPASEWSLERGTRSWNDVPPGTWQVQVTAEDGRTWRATATTVPGVEAEVVLE